MRPLDLERLRSGNSLEWDRAIEWLWPSALSIVRDKLGRSFPSDVEDVAMEALEAVIEKLDEIDDVRELKLLAIALARNKAVDFLRRCLAGKRGKGKVKSLEQVQEDNPETLVANELMAPLVPLDTGELMKALEDLMVGLGSQEVVILRDFYLRGLSYSEIAKNCGMPMGSIGVVLQRALEKLREAVATSPKIMKELKEYLR